MNRSKPGLNEPFYKWLDDVRRAIRKEKELLEKLEYYNMKFVGYKGVNYERIGSSSSSGKGDEELLYWLEKIDQVQDQLKKVKNVLTEASSFRSKLNESQVVVFDHMINKSQTIKQLQEKLKVNNSRIYAMRLKICMKWRNDFYEE